MRFICCRIANAVYGIGVISAVSLKIIKPMLKLNQEWELGMEAWYPYELTNMRNFLLTFAAQMVGGMPLIFLHISVDSFFVGLVLQLCTQLKILKYRLKNFATDTNKNGKFIAIDDEESKKACKQLSTYAERHAGILK